MDEGKISYSSELSEKGFAEGASRIRQEVQGLTNSVEKSGKQIDSVYDKMSQKMKQAFAVGSLVAFQNEIIKVRGEMESLQISFETLAGKQVGKQLYEDIKQFAVNTPMMMGDLAKGAQTLLGFNIEAQKVMPILKQIGDISMGDSQKFNSLTLAFAQMSSTGKLMGQDLLQMINAGFNPLVVISEKTGKSIGQLKQEMEKGAISVDMVQDAFRTATSEGGLFYGMLEKQSKGMAGAMSNMKGAYEDMLNEIGTAEQGILVEGTKLATTLLQNYEAIGKVILELIATYGSYKAAVIVVSTAEAFLNGQYVLKTRLLRAAAAAQALLNKTMLANPAVLVATGVLSLVSALVIFKDRSDKASEAQQKLNDAFGETEAKMATEQKNIDTLFDKLRKAEEGTNEYKETKKAILDQYGQYLKGLNSEISTLKDVEGAYKAVAKAARDAALAKGREAAIGTAQSDYNQTYSEYIGKIYDAIQESAGEKNAKKAIDIVKKDLQETGRVAEDTQRTLNKFGASYSWFGELNKAEQGLSDTMQKINTMFGEQTEKAQETTEAEEKLNITYKKAEESYRNAKKWKDEIEKNKSDYTAKEYEEAVKKLKAAKEAFENVGGDPDGKLAKAGEKAADEQSKRNAKTVEQEQQFQDELTLIRKRAEDARSDASLLSIKNNAERERAEREAQHQRNLRDIYSQEDEIYKAIYERRKASYENTTGKEYENTKEGKVGWQGVKDSNLTDSEKKYFNERSKLIKSQLEKENAEYSRYLDEQRQQELQSMYDYLKSYGTFQEQKLAIAKEYSKKISEAEEAGNTWEVKRLRAENNAQQAQVDANALQRRVDWATVFGDFGIILREQLKTSIDSLREYTKTKEFQKLAPTDQKAVYEALQKGESQIGGSTLGDLGLSKLGDSITRYQESLRMLDDAEREHKKALTDNEAAVEQVTKAQKTYDQAKKSGTAAEKFKAQVELDIAKENADKTTKLVEDTKEVVESCNADMLENQSFVNQEAARLHNQLSGIVSGLQGLGSGSLSGIWEGFTNLDKSLNNNKIAKKIEDAFGEGSMAIIGQVMSILDILKDGIGTLISSLIDTVFNAVTGVIGNVLSGDMFTQIGESLYNGIEGLANTLTFGAIGDLNGSNEEAVAKRDAELVKSQDNLQRSIDKLRETFEKSNGQKAIDSASQMIADQKEINRLQWERFANEMGYHGSHHSNNHEWEGFSEWQINRMNQIFQEHGSKDLNGNVARINGNSWMELGGLTPEAISDLRTYGSDIWDFITSRGYYGEVYDQLNAYADLAGKVGEIEEQLKDNLTQLTTSGLHDSFVSELMDMEKSAADFSDDFSEMLMKAVINAQVGNVLDEELEAWRKKLGDKMYANGGKLSDSDVEELRGEWDAIVNKGISLRDQMANITGYGSSSYEQEASSKGFQAMGQDLGEELNGRFTALQIAGEQVATHIVSVYTQMLAMTQTQTSSNTYLMELRNMMVTANSYLDDVAKYSKKIYLDFTDKLNSLIDNTKNM